MIKRLTFVRRADHVPAPAFADLWRDQVRREQDAASAERRPRRLVHCVTREGQSPVPHHGVAVAWFDDDADPRSMRPSPPVDDRTRSVIDGSMISFVVEERCVLGDSWLDGWFADVHGERTLLLVGLIERATHFSRREFREYWWSRHRPLANRLIPPELQPLAYVHNYVAPDEPTNWDGVGEMYDASLDVARQRSAWFASEQALPLLEDEQRFLVQSTRQVLVTDCEVILSSS